MVLNISAAFASFQRWSVGLGVERQLNALRATVGLREVQVRGGDVAWGRRWAGGQHLSSRHDGIST